MYSNEMIDLFLSLSWGIYDKSDNRFYNEKVHDTFIFLRTCYVMLMICRTKK